MPKTPIKSVLSKDNIHIETFFTLSTNPELLSSGDTPELILRARYPPISGSTAKDATNDTASAAPSSNALIAGAVTVLPESAKALANTGTKESIKELQPFTAFTAAATLCHISVAMSAPIDSTAA